MRRRIIILREISEYHLQQNTAKILKKSKYDEYFNRNECGKKEIIFSAIAKFLKWNQIRLCINFIKYKSLIKNKG